MTLQYKFIESKGNPINYNGTLVSQMDEIPINSDKIRVVFEGGNSELVNGVVLKLTSGYIELPNGSRVKSLKIWNDIKLPNDMTYIVNCPEQKLKVWNIYKITHTNGLVTEDAWTNNSCMHVQCISLSKRRYNCSDGIGDVDLKNFMFELSW